MGEHLLYHDQHKYTRIASFDDEPTTLQLDISHSLSALQTLASEAEPLRLDTPIAYPDLLPWHELLYSQAALDNVERVILCRGESLISPPYYWLDFVLCKRRASQPGLAGS